MNDSINIKSFDALNIISNSLYDFEHEEDENIKDINKRVNEIIEQVNDRKIFWTKSVEKLQNEIKNTQILIAALIAANSTIPATQLPSIPGYAAGLSYIVKLKKELEIAVENLERARYWLSRIITSHQDFNDAAHVLLKKINDLTPRSQRYLHDKRFELYNYISVKSSSSENEVTE